MRGWIPAIAVGTLGLAACATTDSGGASPPGAGVGECDAGDTQRFVGQRATAEVGQELLRITGARQLRWGPPRSAMTMDFRADRLTVAYDDDYAIERISCG